jgi:CMP-N,N'-diacetyllegionaminic acid synthase
MLIPRCVGRQDSSEGIVPALASHILAVIPARGGSKSVPRKNVQLLQGKPLIAHTIAQALASRHITRVIVSTDDDEILAVSREYGAEVPFRRPAEIAADHTPDFPVFEHAIGWLRDHEQYDPQAIVHLRATYPLRRVETIDAAIGTFLDRPDIDSLRSVNLAHESPYKMWRIGPDGLLVPVARLDDGREGHSLPRQALPKVFWQNGYVDVMRPQVILEQGSMGGRHILPFVTDEDGVEIDYAEDLIHAERMFAAGGIRPPRPATERFPS